jgi:hypothetical protein
MGVLVLIYVLLLVITSIRTLFSGGKREQELEDLLEEAKIVFQEASTSFEALDTTYDVLDSEYQTVFDSADSISENLTQVDRIASGITDEFTSVTQTFSRIESAYAGVIQQYNDVRDVAGLAYIETGSETDGVPISVIMYPYHSDRTEATIVPLTHLSTPSSALVYTADSDGFVDSELRETGSTTGINTETPILRALDRDGSIGTRDAPGGIPTYKNITVKATLVDNKIELVQIETRVPTDTDLIEIFVVNQALYTTVTKDGLIEYGLTMNDIRPDSMYAFGVTGGGQLLLTRLDDDAKDLVRDGDMINIPAYKAATLRDLTKIQSETFDTITPQIDRVIALNKQKDLAMGEADATRRLITQSHETRQALALRHQEVVDEFESFSLDRLVPKKDLLDSYCVLM